MKKVAIAGLFLWLPIAGASAQSICADRPGVATPACTVPEGTVQVETGLAEWGRDRSSGVRSDELVLGATAVKLGISDRLHVEVDVTPFNRSSVRDSSSRETVSGFGDLALAVKYRLTADGAATQIAVLPFVKLPTAKRALGNGKVEGGVTVPIEQAIAGTGFSLGLSPEIDLNADGDGSGHHIGMAQVLALGLPIASRLNTATELWGYWDFHPAGTVAQYGVAGSLAYLLSDHVQLDIGTSIGLNRDAADLQLYSGVSFRF